MTTNHELEPILNERAELARVVAYALLSPTSIDPEPKKHELLRQLARSGWQAEYVEPTSPLMNGVAAVDVYSRMDEKGTPIWLRIDCKTGTITEI